MRRVVPGALAVLLLLLVSDAVAANGITPVSPQRGDTVPAGSRPTFKGRVRGRGPGLHPRLPVAAQGRGRA